MRRVLWGLGFLVLLGAAAWLAGDAGKDRAEQQRREAAESQTRDREREAKRAEHAQSFADASSATPAILKRLKETLAVQSGIVFAKPDKNRRPMSAAFPTHTPWLVLCERSGAAISFPGWGEELEIAIVRTRLSDEHCAWLAPLVGQLLAQHLRMTGQ